LRAWHFVVAGSDRTTDCERGSDEAQRQPRRATDSQKANASFRPRDGRRCASGEELGITGFFGNRRGRFGVGVRHRDRVRLGIRVRVGTHRIRLRAERRLSRSGHGILQLRSCQARATLRVLARECRFIFVNLDSSRRKAVPARALKTQLREVVRAQILDAAEELIAARGLHGAALAQIARKAGVAVGTLYNYFADRDAMIRALFESRRTALRPKLLGVIGTGMDLKFEARLRQFVHEILAVFDEHRRFLKLSMETEYYKLSPSTLAADLNSALETMVAAGVAEKAIEPKKASLFVSMISGTLKAIVMKRVADGQPFVNDADTLVALFLDGARRK